MPIGGIGTGTLWLDGQGRLRVWQIFNNETENRVPDSFFAVRGAIGSGPVVRLLQTEAMRFRCCPSLVYEGGGPIARLFFDTATPVSVRMDAFNPLIPTDADNSSIPCAIFRITAKNEEANAPGSHFSAPAERCRLGWIAPIEGVACTDDATAPASPQP